MSPPMRILVVDIGGTHVKASFSDGGGRSLRFRSGTTMGPREMVRQLLRRLKGGEYDRVSVGYPGLVVHGRVAREPYHLGSGWVGFDLERAFGRPTRVVNDAAMQALGSYRGGSMLFLGLGSGLGSAMIVDGRLLPMELAHLPYRKGRSFEEFVGEGARLRLGRRKWQKEVSAVVGTLTAALEPDYVVLGGGNVRKLRELPPGARRGNNRNAFVGGVRLWGDRGDDASSRGSPRASRPRRALPIKRGSGPTRPGRGPRPT
ncbi:MAG: ROK family protein [Thermoplasmata archaeon]